MYKKTKKMMKKEWKKIKKHEKKEKKKKKKKKKEKEDDCHCEDNYEMNMDTAMHYMGSSMAMGIEHMERRSSFNL